MTDFNFYFTRYYLVLHTHNVLVTISVCASSIYV